jgi:hypothetical protein
MKKLVLLIAIVMGVGAMQAQTRTAIKLSDLPKAITENIASHHQGWTALEAFKINTKNVLTYEVNVKKAESQMNLVYDKEGKYLKMEPHKLAINSAAKPSANSKTNSNAGKHKHADIKK